MQRIPDFMTRNVQVVRPDESLQRAAQVMDELDAGSLPMCDLSGRVGKRSDRDIAAQPMAAGLPAPARVSRVSDAMTGPARRRTSGQRGRRAMAPLVDMQIRRLPVIAPDQCVPGIASPGDLATRHPGRVAAAPRRSSNPPGPDRGPD